MPRFFLPLEAGGGRHPGLVGPWLLLFVWQYIRIHVMMINLPSSLQKKINKSRKKIVLF